MRELHEETGFVAGVVQHCSPIMCGDPGLSSSLMRTVVVRVDGAVRGETRLDEGEYIDTHLVEIDGLLALLTEFEGRGYLVDSKIYHFALGVDLAKMSQ